MGTMRTGGYKCGYLIFPLLRTVAAQVRVYDHGPQKWNKKNQRTTFITLLVLSRNPPVLWSRWNNPNWRFFDSDFLAQKIGTTILWSKQNRWVVVGRSQKQIPGQQWCLPSMSHVSVLIIIHYCFSSLIFYSYSSRVIFSILWFFIKKTTWLTFSQRFEFKN